MQRGGKKEIDFFGETDKLLHEWGRWSRSSGLGLSYPGLTPFAQEMKRELSNTLAIIEDSEAAQIEKVMLTFKLMNPAAFEVVLLYYVRGLSLSDAALKLKITHGKAKRAREAAINFSMARLFEFI